MGAWIEIYPCVEGLHSWVSHPTMGAWIEIHLEKCLFRPTHRRTPRWVRGLKYRFKIMIICFLRSHPTMGAWIEILALFSSPVITLCRTPRWVRGLK